MKAYSILAGAIALALATPAQADVTVDITGSTAFRVATLDTIKAKFVQGGSFKYAHDKSAGGFNGATRAIFIGTFPGVSGITTIRTSFNGSVEGIGALINSPAEDPTYYDPSVLNGVNPSSSGTEVANPANPTLVKDRSEIAFSDVTITSTPFKANLQPANAAVGVVVFTMIANESAPANLTNITSQQFRALFRKGYQPLSLFTGDAADETKTAIAVGRNDGSGTRTTYLAETGYGISNLVEQYIVTSLNANDSDEIAQVQRTRARDGVVPPAAPGPNASTIWGQDVDGNGGYSSGSSLRGDLGKKTSSVTVLDADGSDLFGAPIPAVLVSFLSAADAAAARPNGAKILGYNGVTLESLKTQSTLSAADRAKITSGQYTAWGYQQMYRRPDANADTITVYNGIKGGFNATTLGASGIPLSEMKVGREVDGGIVAP